MVCAETEYAYIVMVIIVYVNLRREDTEAIRIRKSKKDGQHYDQKKMDKRTKNDLRNVLLHIKINWSSTRNPLKWDGVRGELRRSLFYNN